jgi:hypothetical protein
MTRAFTRPSAPRLMCGLDAIDPTQSRLLLATFSPPLGNG